MTKKPKVVIVGGGFGGLWAANALANKPVDVALIDRKNHHVFQPLLYQVATAVLSPGEIATPIRRILHYAKNIEVILGEVLDFDPTHHQVILEWQLRGHEAGVRTSCPARVSETNRTGTR